MDFHKSLSFCIWLCVLCLMVYRNSVTAAPEGVLRNIWNKTLGKLPCSKALACPKDLYCSNESKRCMEKKPIHDNCTESSQCESNYCFDPSIMGAAAPSFRRMCIGTSNRTLHDPCQKSSECNVEMYFCHSTNLTCAAKKGKNAACASNEECAFQSACDQGICREQADQFLTANNYYILYGVLSLVVLIVVPLTIFLVVKTCYQRGCCGIGETVTETVGTFVAYNDTASVASTQTDASKSDSKPPNYSAIVGKARRRNTTISHPSVAGGIVL